MTVDGKKVLYIYKPDKNKLGIDDNIAFYSDMAEEYAIVEADSYEGVMVYGKYHGKWLANPHVRWLIKELYKTATQLEKENEELRGLLEDSISVAWGNPDISSSAYLASTQHEEKVNNYLKYRNNI